MILKKNQFLRVICSWISICSEIEILFVLYVFNMQLGPELDRKISSQNINFKWILLSRLLLPSMLLGDVTKRFHFFFFFWCAKSPLISSKKRIIVQMNLFFLVLFSSAWAFVWLAGCWFWCRLMLHFERLGVMKREESFSPCHVFAFSACVRKRAFQRDWVEAAVINYVLIPSLLWFASLWNGCLYVQVSV